MKKEKNVKINDNGSTTILETLETKPEDGFVYSGLTSPVKLKHYGKDNTIYHKGYSKTFIYTTNDPRITRKVAYTISGILLAIGILMLLLNDWFFGISFTTISLFAFLRSKKDINKKAKELKKQRSDVTIDFKEEEGQQKNEFISTFKAKMKDAISSTLTKNNFNWFIKISLSIYSIVVISVSLLLAIFVNLFLGLFIFCLLTASELLCFFVLSKIFINKNI